MRRYFVTITMALAAMDSVIALSGCEDSPVDIRPVNDPRTYTWTIDTLAYPGSFQTTMEGIWSSSPADVYVVGHNDQPGPGTMFRFNGKDWTTTGFHAVEGGSISGPVSLTAIYGFAANDIWVVGERIYTNPTPPPNFLDSSLIIHYDGNQWLEHQVSGGRILQSVWGAHPADVWAGGIYGSLYHFDGLTWKKERIDPTLHFGAIFGISSSDVYAAAGRIVDLASPQDSAQYLLLYYDGTSWAPIDSFLVYPGYPGERFGYSAIWGASSADVYSVSQMVYKKENNSWRSVLSTGLAFYGIFGSSGNNIFAVGNRSQVYHFNGVDWFRYDRFNSIGTFYLSVWTEGSEVFVVGHDGNTTYVLHGK